MLDDPTAGCAFRGSFRIYAPSREMSRLEHVIGIPAPAADALFFLIIIIVMIGVGSEAASQDEWSDRRRRFRFLFKAWERSTMLDASVWKERGRRLGVMLAGSALGAETRKFEGHTDAVTGVAFFADGRRSASCGDGADSTVRVWDIETGRELRRFSAGNVGLSALAVSPDGKAVLAAGRDHVIRLWIVDGPPDAKPKRLEGHGDVVNHLTFSPDGKLAASTSWDGTARLWDVASGKEMRKLEGHQGSVKVFRSRPTADDWRRAGPTTPSESGMRRPGARRGNSRGTPAGSATWPSPRRSPGRLGGWQG